MIQNMGWQMTEWQMKHNHLEMHWATALSAFFLKKMHIVHQ